MLITTSSDMPSSSSISIRNQTGVPQDYAFFSGAPNVSGGMSGPILTNIIATAHHTPNGATATFIISNNYFAICGRYEGTPESGGTAFISKTVPVTLGSRSEGNVITKGSTVPLSVFEGSNCDLGLPTTPGGGKLGCFQISTVVDDAANAFTFQDAITSETSPLAALISWPCPLTRTTPRQSPRRHRQLQR